MDIITDDAFVRLFQQRNGLKDDGWAGHDTIAALDTLLPPKPASSDVVPDDYWPMLAQIESGGKPYAKAPTSSGSGLYQFVRSTWLAEGGSWGADASKAFGGLSPSAEEQTARVKSFTAKSVAYLHQQGVAINKASLYAAHFFGPVTAARVIAADGALRADVLAGQAATAANPSILRGKTVGQFLTWLHGKTGEWAK